MAEETDISRLLEAHAAGDRAALEALVPLVYEHLRQMANARLRRERNDHTFGATELVHEAYIRLADVKRLNWRNRAHFFAVASTAMRNVLVDYAKRRNAQKRGGEYVRVDLDAEALPADANEDDLLALDEALNSLATIDPRQARIVECRFFGGMSLRETAEALEVSEATVSRDWMVARAWLGHRLAAESSPSTRSEA